MQIMRRILGEMALLAGGVLLGIVLISITTLNSGVGHPFGSVTWGYRWVWRWAASASPGYTNLVILYEDVGFWLVLSVALAEVPVRIAALSISQRLRGSSDLGIHRPNGQISRGLLVVASAIIIAALLISASMFVGVGQTTTTETVTTTDTLTTTSTSTMPAILKTTSTATVTCSSNTTPCGSFTYSPIGQLQVNSIQVTQQVCQNCGAVNGESYVYFGVTIENVGNSTIYIAGGSGELSSSVPTNSSVLHQVTTQVCAGTFEIVALNQGQSYTLYAPGCDSGLMYQQVAAGSVNVSFSFHWTTTANSSVFSNTTTISATFTFA